MHRVTTKVITNYQLPFYTMAKARLKISQDGRIWIALAASSKTKFPTSLLSFSSALVLQTRLISKSKFAKITKVLRARQIMHEM